MLFEVKRHSTLVGMAPRMKIIRTKTQGVFPTNFQTVFDMADQKRGIGWVKKGPEEIHPDQAFSFNDSFRYLIRQIALVVEHRAEVGMTGDDPQVEVRLVNIFDDVKGQRVAGMREIDCDPPAADIGK